MNEFGVWVYYTNYRMRFAPQGKSFPEGENYPLINISDILQMPPYSLINGTSLPVSNNYININIQSGGTTDSVVSVISNTDYMTAESNTDSIASFQYQISNNNFSGSTNIAGKYYSKLNTQIPQFWVYSEILNNLLTSEGAYTGVATDYPFPSPFRYNNPNSMYIYIPVDKNNSGQVTLNIYSMGMRLVYSSIAYIETPFGNPIIKWKPENTNNEKLSSGIYIYAVSSGGNIKKGKIIILN
jgi:hypothetical protein